MKGINIPNSGQNPSVKKSKAGKAWFVQPTAPSYIRFVFLKLESAGDDPSGGRFLQAFRRLGLWGSLT
jgi:hypothetical protein